MVADIILYAVLLFTIFALLVVIGSYLEGIRQEKREREEEKESAERMMLFDSIMQQTDLKLGK